MLVEELRALLKHWIGNGEVSFNAWMKDGKITKPLPETECWWHPDNQMMVGGRRKRKRQSKKKQSDLSSDDEEDLFQFDNIMDNEGNLAEDSNLPDLGESPAINRRSI